MSLSVSDPVKLAIKVNHHISYMAFRSWRLEVLPGESLPAHSYFYLFHFGFVALVCLIGWGGVDGG